METTTLQTYAAIVQKLREVHPTMNDVDLADAAIKILPTARQDVMFDELMPGQMFKGMFGGMDVLPDKEKRQRRNHH